MGPIRLMTKEMLRRPLGMLLSVAAVTAAVAVPVMTVAISGGLGDRIDATAAHIRGRTKRISWEIQDEARRIMRDMGVNLLIMHEDNVFAHYMHRKFPLTPLPEEYVAKLAHTPGIVADHYIGRFHMTAQARSTRGGADWQDVYVTGTLEEHRAVDGAGKGKSDMPTALAIRRTGSYVPGWLAKKLGVRKGGRMELRKGDQTVSVRVERLIPERMLRVRELSDDTVYLHLHTAQELAGGKKVISAIEALSCRCRTGIHPQDFLDTNARLVREALPGARMHVRENIWLARETMRREAQKKGKAQESLARQSGESFQRYFQGFFGIISAILVVLGAVLVGLLMIANVRERRGEVGVLLAVGWRPAKVGAVFGSKAVVIGAVGGVVGVIVGLALAAGAAGGFAGMLPAAEEFVPPRPAATQPATGPAAEPAAQPASRPATQADEAPALGARFEARSSKRRGPPTPKPPAAGRLKLTVSPLLLLIALLGAPALTLAASSFAILRATHTDPAVTLAQR